MKLKRILAFALVLILTLGLFPARALADDELTAPDYICGLEAHAHGEACYELICGKEVSEGHTHGDDCYEKTLTCGLTESEGHTHTEECKKEKTCAIPEKHVHTEAEGCFALAAQADCPIAEHEHTAEADCFELVEQITCTNTEEGHVHDDSCKAMVPGEEVKCTQEVHTHSDACLISAMAEEAGCEIPENHTHGDTCYAIRDAEVCGQTEAEGHAHGDDCYENGLKCTLTEAEGHAHEDACRKLICELAEHEHDETCLPQGCDECGEMEGHLEICPEYVCPECGGTMLHKAECSKFVIAGCYFCHKHEGHSNECPLAPIPATFGSNPPYRGVGALAEYVPMDEDTQVMLFSANPMVMSLGLDDDSANDSSRSGQEISSADGSVSGKKTAAPMTDDGDDVTTEDGDQIYRIDLNAKSNSVTTGASCDFVLILDMSYSMNSEGKLEQLKAACREFVTELASTSKFSRVAIVTYGGDQNKTDQYYIQSVADDKVLAYGNVSHEAATGSNGKPRGYHTTLETMEAGNNKQLWTVNYKPLLDTEKDETNSYVVHDTGEVTVSFINVDNGQALEVTTGHSVAPEGTLNNVLTWHETHGRNGQRWAMDPVSEKIQEREEYVFTSRARNRDANGKAARYNLTNNNGSVVIAAVNNEDDHQRWRLVPAKEPSYETYYWTNSTAEAGYWTGTGEVHGWTADSYANTALLTVTEEDPSNSQNRVVSTKLLNAINALTVYGEAIEGSNPGEAVEKAARIYEAVKVNNHQCEETGELYRNAKRGVLYFSDGTPSPSDQVDRLDNFPDSEEEGIQHYEKYYDFYPTYVDAQHALNWSLVLKADRTKTIQDQYQDTYLKKGKLENVYDGKGFYGGVPQTEDQPDILYGCGATLYTVTINLPTYDLLFANCNPSRHGGIACVQFDVIDESNTTITICKTMATYSSTNGGFVGSFDSSSNEYFYRFSSHDIISWHISTIREDAGAEFLTAAQLDWDKKLYWNQKYPDLLCRNQVGSYFLACDKASDLADRFKDIAVQTGKKLENLTMLDNITPYFNIIAFVDENNNIVASENDIVYAYKNTDGNQVILQNKADAPEGVAVYALTRELTVGEKITTQHNGQTLTGVVQKGLKDGKTEYFYITWEPFTLDPGQINQTTGTAENVKDFEFSFYVAPKDGFLGGNHVSTNDGAMIINPNGDTLVELPDPDVDVEISENQGIGATVEARAGSSYLSEVSYDDIMDLITVKVDEKFNLQPGNPENNYGLEEWQRHYVNFAFALYDTVVDENGNISEGAEFSETDAIEIRRNHQMIFKIWIWPTKNADGTSTDLTTPPEGLAPATCTVTINVHYPTFVFADETLYYGQEISSLTRPWEEMIAQKYLHWYTDDEYDQMEENEKNPEHGKFTVDQVKQTGFKPLTTSGTFNGVGDEPGIYLRVNPIDTKVPYTAKTGSSVDNSFYTKYGNYMLKQDIGMNVRVYFANDTNTGIDLTAPLRHAFFLHAINEEGATDACKKIGIHTSGGRVSKGLDGQHATDMDLLEEYWLPEFYIHPKTCQLTIQKTGGIPGETYVFHLKTNTPVAKVKREDVAESDVANEDVWVDYTSVSVTVGEDGTGSVTLYEMPVGAFVITEDMKWSWRFNDPGTKTVTLEPKSGKDSAAVTFENKDPIDEWFSGMSAVVKNIFGTPQKIER